MKVFKKCSFFTLVGIFLITVASVYASIDSFSNFYNWKEACDQLPRFKKSKKIAYDTPLSSYVFEQEIDKFFLIMQRQFNSMFWVDGIRPDEVSNHFQAYVEKLILPSTAIIAIHGDIHGDVHSVNHFIEECINKGFLDKKNPFKIKDKNFYIVFLGDYVDKGWYGAEVIYTVLKLKNENPDNVFMVRGNHEDIDLNYQYSFYKEMNAKFASQDLYAKIGCLYNLLPVALYLGAGKDNAYNIIQCCHGGIELGFDPKKLLETTSFHGGCKIDFLMQQVGFNQLNDLTLQSFEKYFIDKPISSLNGFMWNDFIVNSQESLALSSRDGYSGQILEYGKSVTKKLLMLWSGHSYQLHSIFRAHQHGDQSMRDRILNKDKISHPDDTGIGKLWIENSIHQHESGLLDDVAVITFPVTPDAGYAWPMHTYAFLYMADDYADWRLRVSNHEIM